MATIKQVAQAFVAGKSAQCHNAYTANGFYFLHGHQIANWCDDGTSFNWCGWYTPTTANHINHILDAMGAGVWVAYSAARDGKAPREFYVPRRRA